MFDSCILIDEMLYEIHCQECDEILGILELKKFQEQSYLCKNCGIIINNQRAEIQEQAQANL